MLQKHSSEKKTPLEIICAPFGKHFEERYKNKYRRARLLFIIDLILLGTIILISGILIWFTFKNPAPAAARLKLTTVSDLVKSAGNTQFKISYENISRRALADGSLALRFPDTFELQKVEPRTSWNQSTHTAAIGTLEPGGNGALIISGKFYAPVGAQEKILAVLNFGEEKREQVSQTFIVNVDKSIVSGEIKAPTEIVVGEPFDLEFVVKNSEDAALENIKITPLWPTDWTLIQSMPDQTQNGWNINRLEAGAAEANIKIRGVIKSGSNAAFGFNISLRIGERELAQGETKISLPILNPRFIMTTEIEPPAESIKLGDELALKVKYENAGQFTLRNVIVKIPLENQFIDWKTTEGASSDETSVFWNPSANLELKNIVPGAKGTLSMKIKTRMPTNSAAFAEKTNFNLRFVPEAKFTLAEHGGLGAGSTGEPLELRVQTNVELAAFGRYFTEDGDRLGRGPLPPRVGAATRYWLFWHIANTTNALQNVVVEAALPEGVSLTGRSSVSAGNPLVFDDKAGVLRWVIPNVPPFPDLGETPIGASFEVEIKPSLEDTGRVLKLLSVSRLRATDSWTGVAIASEAAEITTNLVSDFLARGKTKVQPE